MMTGEIIHGNAALPVVTVLLRDLAALEKEIVSYKNEADIWRILEGTSNSAGTLCLHLCGNLQHFIGAVLGGTGYERNRDAEFSLRNVPREKLLEEIRLAVQAVGNLPSLDAGAMQATYPLKVWDKEVATGFFLVHLAGHFNYHLGQINYHRRVLNKN
jgi:hypothetical protein